MPFRIPPLDFSKSPQPFKESENAKPSSRSTPSLLNSSPRTVPKDSPASATTTPGTTQLETKTPRYSVLRGLPSNSDDDEDSVEERDSVETIRPPTILSMSTPSSKYKARNKLQKKICSPMTDQSPGTTVGRNGSIRSRCRSMFGKPPTLRPILSPQPLSSIPTQLSHPPELFDDDDESLPRSSMATWTTEYTGTAPELESEMMRAPTSQATTACSYRCEIHASSGVEQRVLEHKTKARIEQAGGRLLDNDIMLVGGFLYEMPAGVSPPLLGTINISIGCQVVVHAWQPFAQPRFDGLRMNPVGLAEKSFSQRM